VTSLFCLRSGGERQALMTQPKQLFKNEVKQTVSLVVITPNLCGRAAAHQLVDVGGLRVQSPAVGARRPGVDERV